MELKTCKRCKKFFNSIGRDLCPSCIELGEDEFKRVKQYIYDHKGCTKSEIIKECGVTDKQIMTWLREERLELAAGISTGLTCSRCGAPISIGKMCSKCIMAFQNEASAINQKPAERAEAPKQASSTGMRFIGK